MLLKVTVAGKPYSSTKSSDPTSTQYQHITKTPATGVHFNQLHFVNHFLCLVLWFTKLFIIRYDLSDCLMFSRTLSFIHSCHHAFLSSLERLLSSFFNFIYSSIEYSFIYNSAIVSIGFFFGSAIFLHRIGYGNFLHDVVYSSAKWSCINLF